MNHPLIIQELLKNKAVFRELLHGIKEEMFLWKPSPGKWCLLEIICHLYDEEREDFRARFYHILKTPAIPFTPIDPPGWVKQRNYIQQNFDHVLKKFLEERELSVNGLLSLHSPAWDNTYNHPDLGLMSAGMILANWLAHDYLHFRQIIKLKFDYLQQHADQSLAYAGNW